jgi:NOL1/NOP2/fmu family ribosome biogenesis protein
MLIVKAPNAKIYASADDGSAMVFSADKGVLLELAEPAASGWVKVKHRDGQIGYAKVTEVWGSQ